MGSDLDIRIGDSFDDIARRNGYSDPKNTEDIKRAYEQKAQAENFIKQTLVEPQIIDTQSQYTDMGNARMLANLYGNKIKYCYPWNSWLVWTGKQWIRDTSGEVMRYAKATVKELKQIADTCNDSNYEKMVKHAIASQSKGKLFSMIELAQSEPGMQIMPDDLDRDKWLFNLQDGTFNLRTSILQPHNPQDYITKISLAYYNSDNKTSEWIKFLDRIMAGNKDMILFLQKMVGCCLTGDTSLEYVFIFYGTGANGKSKFVDAISHVLGDYAAKTSITTVFEMGKEGGIPNDVARLKGIRFAYASEPKRGSKLDEGKLKDLTGREKVTCRFLNQEYFEYSPEFKLVISTNHKPIIKGADDGIWRRVKLIPFSVTIPPNERDEQLDEKLHAESAGIFKWAAEGVRLWKQEGLNLPKTVTEATEEYRDEMDTLADFLNVWVEKDNTAYVTHQTIYDAYTLYCQFKKEYQMSGKAFTQALEERGWGKASRNSKSRIIKYIKLKPHALEALQNPSAIPYALLGTTPDCANGKLDEMDYKPLILAEKYPELLCDLIEEFKDSPKTIPLNERDDLVYEINLVIQLSYPEIKDPERELIVKTFCGW